MGICFARIHETVYLKSLYFSGCAQFQGDGVKSTRENERMAGLNKGNYSRRRNSMGE